MQPCVNTASGPLAYESNLHCKGEMMKEWVGYFRWNKHQGENRKEAAGTRDAGGMQPVQGTVLTRKPVV